MAKILHIILIPITILFLTISCGVAHAKGVDFVISSDKAEYSKADAINITFKIVNKSKEEIYINQRFYINSADTEEGEREVYFRVTSPSGEELSCKHKSDTGFPRTDDFVLLKTGNEIQGDRPKNIKGLFDFDSTGTYEIQATYKNIYGKEIGLDVFKEKIDSKPIKIKIAE
ncbi:MAG: hypothetical protein ABH843_02975 [Candidatus Omnitrophota bacterium]